MATLVGSTTDPDKELPTKEPDQVPVEEEMAEDINAADYAEEGIAEDPDGEQPSADYDSRKMDPDEEVFPGGPNFKQINEWKDQYGEVYVTSVTPEKHIVWRTINRFEFRSISKRLEQALASGQTTQIEANLNNEEEIAELIILFPVYDRRNPAGFMAGIASTVSQQALEASGFTSVDVRQL